MKNSQQERFTSRWALLLAALGMAIGTGNIWRFPRIAAKNGGGSFLIAWLVALFLWSIPLLMVEMAMGKNTRFGTVGAFARLIGKRFAWMGAFVGFCAMAIMFYYSVVMGWCVKYFVTSLYGGLSGAQSKEFWDSFSGSPYQPVLFHLVAMGIGSFIAYRGVVRGIEKANKILIPSLFVILMIAAVRALTLPRATDGLRFLFIPHWGDLLNHKIWLEALTQSAWSTGAGWGLILTYSVYMRQKEDIPLNAVLTGVGNNAASLIAAVAIIPTVFALAPTITPPQDPLTIAQQAGPASTGLTFIWMPALFANMPGGAFFQMLFFLALTFAALSSLIAMIELAARIFMDAGMSRRKAIPFVGCIGFMLGVPSAVSLTFFENQDWVWSIGLLISGMFFSFAAIKYGVSRFRGMINDEGVDFRVGCWFDFLVFLIPIEFAALVFWWFSQAIKWDPETWWHPLKTFSLGTCLFQWGVVIVVFLIFNTKLARKTPVLEQSEGP